MALSNAEKQRNWRAREREKREAARRATAVMPVAEHDEKVAQIKARVETWKAGETGKRRELEAEVSRLADEVARLEEELTRSGRRCPACGGELACPRCWQGDDF
jgi:hypothetical protein